MTDTASPSVSVPTRKTILLLGDSLTQLGWDGWAGHVASRYQRRADVLNRGMSGYNTRWFLEYAATSSLWTSSSIPRDNVALVTIFFGANDASDAVLNPRHHVPVPEYQENLLQLIGLCRENFGKDVPIVVMTPPPVVHAQRLAYQKERYKEKATGKLERNQTLAKQYADAAATVAEKTKLPVVHLWNSMQEQKDWESFFYDGLHFTAAGNAFVAEALLEVIDTAYPELKVTPCPYTGQTGSSGSKCGTGLVPDGPFHDEIDHQNHPAAFIKK